MSDWIEKDGKKYYEESYFLLANENAKRNKLDAERYRKLQAAGPKKRYLIALYDGDDFVTAVDALPEVD